MNGDEDVPEAYAQAFVVEHDPPFVSGTQEARRVPVPIFERDPCESKPVSTDSIGAIRQHHGFALGERIEVPLCHLVHRPGRNEMPSIEQHADGAEAGERS